MRIPIVRAFLLVLVVLAAAVAPAPQQPPSTLIINARLVDETGGFGRVASVKTVGDRVTDVGELTRRPDGRPALSEGVHAVWVNGEVVFQHRQTMTVRRGRVLRRESK